MADRQPYQLTAEGSLNTTFVIPVQKADGSEEAKKVTLTQVKTALSLDNVDNTCDADKPVSTAQEEALDLKQDVSNLSTDVEADGSSDEKYPSVKADKDYVDANAGGVIKTIKVTLTSSQILNSFTTPIEIIPADASKLYIPRNIFQKLTFGTVAYTYAGNFRLSYNTASNWVAQFVPFITANDNGENITAININGASVTGGTYSGKSLLVTAVTSDPPTGDGTLDLYVTYLEITI